MIYSVLPLIAKLAGKYKDQDLVEYEDLLQTGLTDVNKAIDAYDPEISCWTTFASTYAKNSFRNLYRHSKRRKNTFHKTMSDIISEEEALQLPDGNCINPLENAEKLEYLEHLSHSLENALRKLHSRDELVVRMRFGLSPYNKRHSLSQIADTQNLSRERVRQITDRALWRLNKLLRDEATLQDG